VNGGYEGVSVIVSLLENWNMKGQRRRNVWGWSTQMTVGLEWRDRKRRGKIRIRVRFVKVEDEEDDDGFGRLRRVGSQDKARQTKSASNEVATRPCV